MELCANDWEAVGEYTVQALREAVATEGENGWLDGPLSRPLVAYNLHWDIQEKRLVTSGD